MAVDVLNQKLSLWEIDLLVLIIYDSYLLLRELLWDINILICLSDVLYQLAFVFIHEFVVTFRL